MDINSTENKMKVLVIVVTYNGLKWVDKCLTSPRSNNHQVDIFVVDNCSNDGTYDYIKENYPNVILSKSEVNLGFGGANNIGLKYALKNNYDYVYLLNQDAWVFEETIDGLVDLSQKHAKYGVISPLQCTASLTAIDANLNLCLNRTIISDSLLGKLEEITDIEKVMAAHWFVPISVIATIGGFSPSFKHYGEDDNFLNRLIWHGYKAGLASRIKVVHDRENRLDTKKKRIFRRNVMSIVDISDINNSLFAIFPKILSRYILDTLRFRSITPLADLCGFLFLLGKYKRNRQQSKKTGAFL